MCLQAPAAEYVVYVAPSGNDMFSGDAPRLNAEQTDGKFTSDKSIYWNPKQRENIVFTEYDFNEWKSITKQDLHSVIADPCFTNVERHDFSFPTDSAAVSIGIPQPGKYGPKARPVVFDDIPKTPTGFVLPIYDKKRAMACKNK